MPHVAPTSLHRRTTLMSALFAAAVLGVLLLAAGAETEEPPSEDEAPPPTLAVAAVEQKAIPEEVRPVVVIEERPTAPRSPEALQRLARARAMGAEGVAIADPCLARLDEACERSALEPFFRALDELRQPDAKRHATVAVFGNSLIAADHIVDVFRLRLVERFGDGGRGFVLADRMAEYGGRTRTGHAARGRWTPHNFSMGERGRFPFGVSGVLHVSRGRSASTTWKIDGERRARVFLYEHEKSPTLELRVDEERVSTVPPGERSALSTLELALPEGARGLTLEATGPGAVVYGAILEREQPGVIVNTFGVPAADAAHFLSAEPELFRAQLLAQDPSLVVVMLGGNETKRLHWGKRKRDEVERDYAALLVRLHEMAPGAGCLAVGPIDSVYGGANQDWRTRSQLSWVIEMQKRVVEEHGCAYFDMFEAMGGAGSLRRFAQRGLLHDDMVHPRRGGLDLLGELLAAALLEAYERTPRVTREPPRK